MRRTKHGSHRASNHAFFTLLVILVCGTRVDAADDVDIARKWVSTLPSHSMYTDGYAIAPNPAIETPEGQQHMVPVLAALYHTRAWQTFLEQEHLSDEQRRPHHYKIGHEVQGNMLAVVIQGLLLPYIIDGKPNDIMRVTLGPSMRLHYALDSGKLIETQLLR